MSGVAEQKGADLQSRRTLEIGHMIRSIAHLSACNLQVMDDRERPQIDGPRNE